VLALPLPSRGLSSRVSRRRPSSRPRRRPRLALPTQRSGRRLFRRRARGLRTDNMEAVKTFNSELYSLNDYKPPISKAKMTQITKAAIKAIKFYKHVVQSVEKFIQKVSI